MNVYKYRLSTLCLILLPLSVTGQEWSKQDSLRLQQALNSEQEIRINKEFVKKTEQNMLYHTKPFVDFDPTLPTLKSTIISPINFLLMQQFKRNTLLLFPPLCICVPFESYKRT